MDTPAAQIAALLHEAGETHHVVYRIVDGDEPDWASWYADWLIDLSELPQILGVAPVRSELVRMLVQLDRSRRDQRSAHRLVADWGSPQVDVELAVDGRAEPEGADRGTITRRDRARRRNH